MTDLQPTHDAITQMAKAIRVAQMQLAGLILAVCPGPHRIMQHSDDREPWCMACRYTRTGDRVAQVDTPTAHGAS